VGQLSDATDTADATEEQPAALPGDGLREGIVDGLRSAIGDQLIATHLVPQTDLWVRVTAEAWPATAAALKTQGFDYFCFLSAIDWLPSPYGKGEDDPSEEVDPDAQPAVMKSGYAGGDTRFQVFGRLTDIRRHVGVTIKADVPESMTVGSWIGSFAGANWHERETHEMFGIVFEGHPDLRNLYLPGEFEGFPLRKDFPLLARMVKPWPGIVDVEPMPADDDDAPPTADTAAGDAVEAATETSAEAAAGDPTIDESAEATVPNNMRGDSAEEGSGTGVDMDTAGSAAAVDEPPVDTDDGPRSDADVAAADAAIAAANATPDAVEPEPADAADQPADAAAAASEEHLAAAEPAPADASETERAERAEAADEAGVSGLDTSDPDTVPADLGPGTTSHATDADAEAPTPGPPTAEHPDGLTPGSDAGDADDDGDGDDGDGDDT
jgi:NADH-quinone oxidoreductase subunit C